MPEYDSDDLRVKLERDRGLTQPERLILVEYQLAELKLEQRQTNAKLDELLQLKAKGTGAFWLASTIIGTGIIGIIMMAVHWIKGNV